MPGRIVCITSRCHRRHFGRLHSIWIPGAHLPCPTRHCHEYFILDGIRVVKDLVPAIISLQGLIPRHSTRNLLRPEGVIKVLLHDALGGRRGLLHDLMHVVPPCLLLVSRHAKLLPMRI